MALLACLDVPGLSLQVALQSEPSASTSPSSTSSNGPPAFQTPAILVTHTRPNGVVEVASHAARQAGIRPGLTVAQALSMAPNLTVTTLAPGRAAEASQAIADALRLATPAVEPAGPRLGADHLGVFWLGATGMSRLHPDIHEWAGAVRQRVRDLGYRSTLVLGFSHFGTWAIARGARGFIATADPLEERALAGRTPLAHLGLPVGVRDTLERLGLITVDQLLDLPEAGVRQRFGPQAHALWRQARGDFRRPIKAEYPLAPIAFSTDLEPPEANTTRLLFRMKGWLHPLLTELATRDQRLAALSIEGRHERGGAWRTLIRPGQPTRELALIVDLIRLRMDANPPQKAIATLELLAVGAGAEHRQFDALELKPRRDLAAGARALARVAAELGDAAVTTMASKDAHLPEAAWQATPSTELKAARPINAPQRLIRRVTARPHLRPIPPPTADAPCGGPYIVSGGWWAREVRREYQFIETPDGTLRWVFWDPHRRRWYEHGVIA